MEKDIFIANYIIQYTALKMAEVNRNLVQNADLAERYAMAAFQEATQVWNIYNGQYLQQKK